MELFSILLILGHERSPEQLPAFIGTNLLKPTFLADFRD